MRYIELVRAGESRDTFQLRFPRLNHETKEQFTRAVGLIDDEQYKKAEPMLYDLAEHFPEFVDAWTYLGLCYHNLALPLEALTTLNMAVFVQIVRFHDHFRLINTNYLPTLLKTNVTIGQKPNWRKNWKRGMNREKHCISITKSWKNNPWIRHTM